MSLASAAVEGGLRGKMTVVDEASAGSVPVAQQHVPRSVQRRIFAAHGLACAGPEPEADTHLPAQPVGGLDDCRPRDIADARRQMGRKARCQIEKRRRRFQTEIFREHLRLARRLPWGNERSSPATFLVCNYSIFKI